MPGAAATPVQGEPRGPWAALGSRAVPLPCESPAPQDTGPVLHGGTLPPSSGGRATEPPAVTILAIREGPLDGAGRGLSWAGEIKH